MTAQREMIPAEFEAQLLDRWAHALIARSRAICENDVMTIVEAAAYVKYSRNYFNSLVSAGKFRAHRVGEGAEPRFIRSELLEDLKAKKTKGKD